MSTRDPVPSGVEQQVADLEDRRSWRPPAPDERPQSGEQLSEREGLRQVVVRAAVQTCDAVLDRVACSEQEDRRPDSLSPQPAAGLEAVDTRQHHVENDGIEV